MIQIMIGSDWFLKLLLPSIASSPPGPRILKSPLHDPMLCYIVRYLLSQYSIHSVAKARKVAGLYKSVRCILSKLR